MGDPKPPPGQGFAGPAWYPDPYGLHRFRYWDGSNWTHHVSEGDSDQVSNGADPSRGSVGGTSQKGRTGTGGKLFLMLGVIGACLVAAIFVFRPDPPSGYSQICELTEEFWYIVDNSTDYSQFDRLVEIGDTMGDGLDDMVEAEGHPEMAAEATRASMGALFADSTGNLDVVFVALERLEVLCELRSPGTP